MVKKRGRGPRALAALLPKLAEPAVRKRGFSAIEIITRWAEIVGPALAADSTPEQLTFPRGARSGGTLNILASGAVALEFQHMEPVIIERINTFFGYAAVARISLIQGQAHKAEKVPVTAPPSPPLSEKQLSEIESSTKDIGPDDLRIALQRLGKAVGTAQIRPK